MLYRGTSLIRERAPLGPYRRPMLKVLGGSKVGGRFLMGEVPLYALRELGFSWVRFRGFGRQVIRAEIATGEGLRC